MFAVIIIVIFSNRLEAHLLSLPAGADPAILDFFKTNWVTILLVLSEIAAFLPPPFNGIVRTIINLITKSFEQKKTL